MSDWKSIDERITNLKANVMRNAVRMKQKYKQNGFVFMPFSQKQKKVLTWWCDASPVKDMDGIQQSERGTRSMPVIRNG